MKAGFFFGNRDTANRVLNRVDKRSETPRQRRIMATLAAAMTRLLRGQP